MIGEKWKWLTHDVGMWRVWTHKPTFLYPHGWLFKNKRTQCYVIDTELIETPIFHIMCSKCLWKRDGDKWVHVG